VTLMSTLGNFLTVVMNLCYGLVAGGVGLASYAINDSARPASFGINVIVTLYCVFAIPIMWMDVSAASEASTFTGAAQTTTILLRRRH
jgi:hypothetical protein